MSRIEELLRKLAPDGVKVELLGDFAQLVRGNGMPKSVLTTVGVGAIHYGQIYTWYGVSADRTISFVSPDTASKLTKVMPGDVIITNTSENFEDIGKAVAWLGSDPIVTGGHATVIKHNEDSKYLAYWFQSQSFFKQKRALASGTKVIDVSAKQLAKVRVPLPPREVQREIARILDGFDSYVSLLSAALKKEDTVRRDEYSYHRDLLLIESQRMSRDGLRWVRSMTRLQDSPRARISLATATLSFRSRPSSTMRWFRLNSLISLTRPKPSKLGSRSKPGMCS